MDITSYILKICDLGFSRFGFRDGFSTAGTPSYQAPELIVGGRCNWQVDIWATACVLFELVTSQQLFKVENCEGRSEDNEMLHLYDATLGKLYKKHVVNGQFYNDFFDARGNFLKKMKTIKEIAPIETRLQTNGPLQENEAKLLGDLLRKMMRFEPKKRISAVQCLNEIIFQYLI
jgi:serine/threonine protein kinase